MAVTLGCPHNMRCVSRYSYLNLYFSTSFTTPVAPANMRHSIRPSIELCAPLMALSSNACFRKDAWQSSTATPAQQTQPKRSSQGPLTGEGSLLYVSPVCPLFPAVNTHLPHTPSPPSTHAFLHSLLSSHTHPHEKSLGLITPHSPVNP